MIAMSKPISRIQDADFTAPEASHTLLRVFDYLWPDPPSPTAPTTPTAPHVPERRGAVRHDPAALTLPTGVRVHPGIDVRLVDVSTRGALVEGRTRLSPGMPVRLILANTGAQELPADGVVLRCSLHSILADRVLYRTAVRFYHTLALPDRVA